MMGSIQKNLTRFNKAFISYVHLHGEHLYFKFKDSEMTPAIQIYLLTSHHKIRFQFHPSVMSTHNTTEQLFETLLFYAKSNVN